MKRIITIGAAAAALLIPAASASAHPIRECGNINGAGIVNITTRGLTCKDARDIARYYTRTGTAPNMYLKVRYMRNGYADVRMTRYSYVVRFQQAQD